MLPTRRWVYRLDNYLSNQKRLELKEAAEAAGVEMVRKTVDADGRTRVSKAEFLLQIRNIFGFEIF